MEHPLIELERLTRGASSQPTETGIPRVSMIRGEVPDSQLAAIYQPVVGVVLQGAKTLRFGDRELRCVAPSYFVLPVELPVFGTAHQGGPGVDYLSVGLNLDRETTANLLADLPAVPRAERSLADFEVCPADEDFLDAWRRLVRLMRTPRDIPALAPVYEREILYRVLQGPQGWMLRDLAHQGSALNRIESAAAWIKKHLADPFLVDDLARQAGMSPTTFHGQFRTATGLSPIQFQKQLRLHRARGHLIAGTHSVATAAYEVGYQSPSQFNREYARLFGRPPAKDAEALRG